MSDQIPQQTSNESIKQTSDDNAALTISKWSWVLIVFSILLAWVASLGYDAGGRIGYAIGTLLIPFFIAYAVRGRASVRNWNSFARWFFWLTLAAIWLQSYGRSHR